MANNRIIIDTAGDFVVVAVYSSVDGRLLYKRGFDPAAVSAGDLANFVVAMVTYGVADPAILRAKQMVSPV